MNQGTLTFDAVNGFAGLLVNDVGVSLKVTTFVLSMVDNQGARDLDDISDAGFIR